VYRSVRNSLDPQPPDSTPAKESAQRDPRILMLGLGWFPSSIGGLDRYYRSLLEYLPEARGVVIGPAPLAPDSIEAVGSESASLLRRLLGFRRAALRATDEVELVDAHFALYALLPLSSRALRSKPSVVHFHGPWAEESLAAGDASPLKLRLRKALEQRVLEQADAVVVLSSAFRRLLVERYRLSPWKIHVWAPGVALENFTPDASRREPARSSEAMPGGLGTPAQSGGVPAGSGAPGSAFSVVCARRLVPRMGIETLLDAWEEALPGLPQGSRLLLIGDGPLRQQLAVRAGTASMAGSVRLMGRVSEEELVEAYQTADVAVVPTLSFEGFGLVVLEAAACGTPSIVSDVGGLPEVVADLDPSLVVTHGDVEALAARLRSASQGELPSRAASRRYAERYDWTKVAERHRRLYRSLAARQADEGHMRVVYLDHVARLSGGEIALLRLLPYFKRVNAHVILGEDGPLADRLAQAGVSVEVLPIAPATRDMRKDSIRAGLAAPAAVFHTLAYVVRLALRLRALEPDVVHTNSLKSGFYGSVAARLARVPMLWHVRDRIAEDYLPRGAVRLTRLLIGRLADGVVANSNATLQTVPASKRNRVHRVIPDSVQPSEHSPARVAPNSLGPSAQSAEGPSAEITFGMLGRIAPWKGQDLFLRAFASAFPTGSERAVIVGSPMFGEQDFEQELLALADDLGLSERVEFRGFREDVWRELASLQVLVHASVIPEPFGQVVLEGMAAGLPVIAPDEGGPASIISDGRTGLLFKSRDVGALAAAMLALREDPGERARLGDAARSALAAYHPAVVTEQLEQVYLQMSGSSR